MVDFSLNIIKFNGKMLFSCGFEHKISRTSLDLGIGTLITFGDHYFGDLYFFCPPSLWGHAVVHG